MRYWWLGMLSFCSVAAPIQEVLPLSTYINKTELYPYVISLDMQPNQVVLAFDEQQQRFQSHDVAVVVSSDISNGESGIGFEYTLSLLRNTSYCRRPYGLEVTQSNVISLTLGGAPFDEQTPLERQLLVSQDDGFLGDKLVLTLVSEVITDEAVQCEGTVMLEAELAL
ncbi:conserved hypothetical protein [Vibrio jasicida]|uniref:DUF4402 domain-containing protein n=1 Tax=Vibrio jasicida TaxID=766224 RepID=A0AAU9QYV6_9VIBR|nr:conserved hypothetical protein [Vibrio jasicida]CAH1603613.1 conserved hypothetical protein [Vibrio jasicida]